MSISSFQATQAYSQTASAINQATGSSQATGNTTQIRPGEADESQFGSLVSDAITQATQSLQTAETAGVAVSTGDANLLDVVTNISAAEVSLEAAISIRNRMIEAYQEIMRMPI